MQINNMPTAHIVHLFCYTLTMQITSVIDDG